MPRKRKTPTGAPAQPVAVASGGAYGSRTMLEQQQQAAPITAPSPTPGGGAPVTPVDVHQVALDHRAPTNVPLTAPTQYPNQPFTAGLDVGAGPGSDALIGLAGLPTTAARDEVGETLRDLYARFPYPGIRELIEDHDNAQ